MQADQSIQVQRWGEELGAGLGRKVECKKEKKVVGLFCSE